MPSGTFATLAARWGRGAPASSRRERWIQQRSQVMIARNGFLGVPRETFSEGGRLQFERLVSNGMNPESVLLDLGCGCLRGGCWMIEYLNPGCYHGIEPARNRVDLGLKYLVPSRTFRRRSPRLDFNPDFDTSVFGVTFDFFNATSIWTHACKRQIQTMLDGFVAHTGPGAVFLTSYLPPTSDADEYFGDMWVGTSHESDVSGVVRHSLSWINKQCASRELAVRELPGVDCDSQCWLRITHRTSGN
jgi:hypothetical protein